MVHTWPAVGVPLRVTVCAHPLTGAEMFPRLVKRSNPAFVLLRTVSVPAAASTCAW